MQGRAIAFDKLTVTYPPFRRRCERKRSNPEPRPPGLLRLALAMTKPCWQGLMKSQTQIRSPWYAGAVRLTGKQYLRR